MLCFALCSARLTLLLEVVK